MFHAVANDHPVLIALLLDEGGDVTVTNNIGIGVVTLAALNASIETVLMLIDAGADVNVQILETDRGKGLTALIAATQQGKARRGPCAARYGGRPESA